MPSIPWATERSVRSMSKGVFDTLNDALFAQMDKLQSIDPNDTERMEQCIAQSDAVSKLAGNIIGNATTAISLMKFQSMEGGLGQALVNAPKMLGGGR